MKAYLFLKNNPKENLVSDIPSSIKYQAYQV